MRTIRNCNGISLATGKSGCQIDFGKIKAVILVAHGVTLGSSFSKGVFETKCHADVPNRIYPIKTIVEYAKNGGELKEEQNEVQDQGTDTPTAEYR